MANERDVPAAGDEPRAAAKKKAAPRKATQGGIHRGRAAEQRAVKPVRKQQEAPWVNPSSLQAPTARPGMVQRWIRVGTMGKDDPVNLARKLREGWTPRLAESVPDDFPVPRIDHGKFAGCVGVEGMVLMEMPKDRNKQRNDYYRKKGEAITKAIDEDLMRTNAGVRVGGAFGPIQREQRSIPVRERRVEAAEDDGLEGTAD
jgi:hypothetical protein